ncbi:class I adenylate-forming enzyme family protein [Halomarina halobia]|uniref:Class I adenylate-forming enzyme family protein n=1 Tax=Halomarina halobia TaxID=3033386 RepID=A0ABD6ADU3_9EURY|nr:AMP-binding protein [Halomarina sp. PSR21]
MSWPTTLPEVLGRSAEEHGEREAIVWDDRRITYADLQRRVDRFARGLLAMGVGHGDRVGVLAENRPEWFVANYAAQRIGATMVGLNTWYTADELSYALAATDVSTLVTVDSFLDTDYRKLLTAVAPELEGCAPGALDCERLPYLQRAIVVGDAPEWAFRWSDVLDRGESVGEARLSAATETVRPDDDAYVLFSSGTTGRPKPIVLRHDGLATNPRSVGARMGVSADDCVWLAVPLFFSYAACNASVTALSHGATLVLQSEFDADAAVELIAEERCTVLYGMGNMYRRLERSDGVRDALDSVRVAMAIAPRSLRERLEALGADVALTGYGLTEVCAICAVTDHEAHEEARLGTVGHPLANVDVRVVDPDTDREVPPGDEGEIRLRARTLFREYRTMPERTRAAFDPAGYFRTGDLGRLTPAGRLVFEGRLKDIIKTGGINVSPTEVESVIGDHPAVDAVTVLGLPHDERDEVVAAVVRPVEGETLTADAVREHCRERLSSYKVPTVVEFRSDPFPRTATGKVRKDVVRESL